MGGCRLDASGILSVEKAESVIKRVEEVEVEEPVLEAADVAAGNDTAADDAEPEVDLPIWSFSGMIPLCLCVSCAVPPLCACC